MIWGKRQEWTTSRPINPAPMVDLVASFAAPIALQPIQDSYLILRRKWKLSRWRELGKKSVRYWSFCQMRSSGFRGLRMYPSQMKRGVACSIKTRVPIIAVSFRDLCVSVEYLVSTCGCDLCCIHETYILIILCADLTSFPSIDILHLCSMSNFFMPLQCASPSTATTTFPSSGLPATLPGA